MRHAQRIAPLLLIVALLSGLAGCQTSRGYQAAVHQSYPVVADRLAKYQLAPDEAAQVATLREVSADEKAVRYETARPAWETAAPAYRSHVAADDTLSGALRADYMGTADKLDTLQAKEAKYRATLGTAPQP